MTIEGDLIQVGVQDSPTKQQIIDKLVSIGAGRVTDLTGLKFRVAPPNHLCEPLNFSGGSNPLTGSSGLTQGNNNIGTLLGNGWTVTTN